MLSPAADMSPPESESICTIVDPLGVEISAWMVGAGWIPLCDVLFCSRFSCLQCHVREENSDQPASFSAQKKMNT